MGNVQIDDHFNKCIWQVVRHIDEAFSSLAEQCAMGKLTMDSEEYELWEDVAKEKASQANRLIAACINSQFERYLDIWAPKR